MWSLASLFTRSTQQPAVTQAKPDDIQENNAASSFSETDSAQTTPKASATVSVVQVPELNLQESDQPTTQDAPTITSSSTPTTNASLMPPPSTPRLSNSTQQQQRPPTLKPVNQGFLAPPKPKASAPLRTPPSAASTLRNPPAAANGLTTSTLAPAQRGSRKVILGPGHSPLDWATLTKDPRNNLRGANLPPTLIKVTPSMLKTHNGRKGSDAWTSYNGKVYNITPYVSFHPGGKGELLRGAGKDSGKLFLETHPWVNWDGILGECLVGILVSENEKGDEANELDAMD